METVETKPVWKSKIFWTNLLAALASLLAVWQIDLTTEQQVTLVTAGQISANVLTLIWRTWFNRTVTPE